MVKIGRSPCAITTRLEENERPSLSRSTVMSRGRRGSPARRKYPCKEWGRRPAPTVAPAARRPMARGRPPYIPPSSLLGPFSAPARKRSPPSCSRAK